MVARRRWEGKMRERKTRKSTDRMEQPSEGRQWTRRKNKKGVISWPQKASYLDRCSNRNQPRLSRSERGVLIKYETFNDLNLNVKYLCADLA